ncbi:MAG: hypothetical protein ACRC62_13030 [Microcoleus sp.]
MVEEDREKVRRDRRAAQARDRRRKRGLKSRGGAGRGQGRKMVDVANRPTCCNRLMRSSGRSWRCPICKTSERKAEEKID